MTKCLLFPGQGTQKPGMLKELGNRIYEVEDIFEIASDISGKDVKKLCLQGSAEELKQTENTQLAVTAMNMAYIKLLKADGVDYQVVAGHSLGQYSALAAAEAISLEQLFALVNTRAKLMGSVKKKGMLCSIVGLSYEKVSELCNMIDSSSEKLGVALRNSDIQIVVGGESKEVEIADAKAKEAGAIKTTLLNVSNAFHTNLMQEMVDEFSEYVNKLDIKNPTVWIMLNNKKDFATSPEDIKKELIEQCCHTVYWVDGIKKIISQYDDICFLETGIGKTLAGMMRHIDSSKKVFLVSKPSDYKKLIELG